MKLHAYLRKSRHAIFYFRWPIPRLGPQDPRRTFRLSLPTRCPREAESLARRLEVCGETLHQHIGRNGMNYGELRTRIEQHFRSALAEGKRRRSEQGPFTQKEKAGLRETIDLASMDNMDYRQLLGRDNARADLDEFCTKIGIDVPTTPETVNRHAKLTPNRRPILPPLALSRPVAA